MSSNEEMSWSDTNQSMPPSNEEILEEILDGRSELDRSLLLSKDITSDDDICFEKEESSSATTDAEDDCVKDGSSVLNQTESSSATTDAEDDCVKDGSSVLNQTESSSAESTTTDANDDCVKDTNGSSALNHTKSSTAASATTDANDNSAKDTNESSALNDTITRSDVDNYTKILMISNEVGKQIMSGIETVVTEWHRRILKVLGNCKNPKKCPSFQRPSDSSCHVCLLWYDLIDCIVFSPGRTQFGELKWKNVRVSQFSKDPVEIVKLFITHIPDNRQEAVKSFQDVDARGALQILGSLSFLLDTREKWQESLDFICKELGTCMQMQKQKQKQKFFPKDDFVKKFADSAEATKRKKACLETINYVLSANHTDSHIELRRNLRVDQNQLYQFCWKMDQLIGEIQLEHLNQSTKYDLKEYIHKTQNSITEEDIQRELKNDKEMIEMLKTLQLSEKKGGKRRLDRSWKTTSAFMGLRSSIIESVERIGNLEKIKDVILAANSLICNPELDGHIEPIETAKDLIELLEDQDIFTPNNLHFIQFIFVTLKEDKLVEEIGAFAENINPIPLHMKTVKRRARSHHFLAKVKIEGHLSDATGETIESLRTKLAHWLPIDIKFIKFSHLKEGCIEVIFELPNTVKDTLLSKATKQHAAWFADIISISIDDEEPIYVNSAVKGGERRLDRAWKTTSTFMGLRSSIIESVERMGNLEKIKDVILAARQLSQQSSEESGNSSPTNPSSDNNACSSSVPDESHQSGSIAHLQSITQTAIEEESAQLPSYNNWVKSSEGLQECCRAAAMIVEKVMCKWHISVTEEKETDLKCAGYPMCNPTLDNGIPNKPKRERGYCTQCVKFAKVIEDKLAVKKPPYDVYWKHVKSSDFFGSPIQVAKLFGLRLIPADELAAITTFDKFDSAWLLSIMEKVNLFHEGDIRSQVQNATTMRNKIMHRPVSLEMTDEVMYGYLDSQVKLLQCFGQHFPDIITEKDASNIQKRLDKIERTINEHMIGRLEYEDLRWIADMLGHDWKRVGTALGFEPAEIQRLEVDYPRPLVERIYQMFVIYRQKYPSETCTGLCNAFNECGRSDIAGELEKRITQRLQIKPSSPDEPPNRRLAIDTSGIDMDTESSEDFLTHSHNRKCLLKGHTGGIPSTSGRVSSSNNPTAPLNQARDRARRKEKLDMAQAGSTSNAACEVDMETDTTQEANTDRRGRTGETEDIPDGNRAGQEAAANEHLLDKQLSDIDILDVVKIFDLVKLHAVYMRLNLTAKDYSDIGQQDPRVIVQQQTTTILTLWCDRNGHDATREAMIKAMEKCPDLTDPLGKLKERWADRDRHLQVDQVDIVDIVELFQLLDLDDLYDHLKKIEMKDIENIRGETDRPLTKKQAKKLLHLWKNRNGEAATRKKIIEATKLCPDLKKQVGELEKKWKEQAMDGEGSVTGGASVTGDRNIVVVGEHNTIIIQSNPAESGEAEMDRKIRREEQKDVDVADQQLSDIDILNIVKLFQLNQLKYVYPHLGLTDRDINNIIPRDGILEEQKKQAKEILTLWYNRNGKEATRRVLLDAMERCENLKVSVTNVSKEWKQQGLDKPVSQLDILYIVGLVKLRYLNPVYVHLEKINNTDIENIKVESRPTPTESQASKLLHLWVDRNGEDATRKKMIKAIEMYPACQGDLDELEDKWKMPDHAQ